MTSIVTVTLNPCIDKSFSVPYLVPEKKLPCSSPLYEAGGGGVNVARAIKKLGGDPLAIYFAGGHNGKLLTHLLSREGVRTSPIEIKESTRENSIIWDGAAGCQYRFNLPGPTIQQREWEACLCLLGSIDTLDFLVLSGSFTQGIPLSAVSTLTALANSKQGRIVVDTSGDALRAAVHEEVYLIKPSLGELAILTGVSDLSAKSGLEKIANLSKSVISKGRCYAMLVSLGSLGALLVTRDQTTQICAPPIQVRSTVGAGDSMVAGTVLSLTSGKNLYEAACYGVACGTAATLNSGTGLCQITDVDRIFNQIISFENLNSPVQQM